MRNTYDTIPSNLLSPAEQWMAEDLAREDRVKEFFRAYEDWSNSPDDDAQEIRELEHRLRITRQDWAEYHEQQNRKVDEITSKNVCPACGSFSPNNTFHKACAQQIAEDRAEIDSRLAA